MKTLTMPVPVWMLLVGVIVLLAISLTASLWFPKAEASQPTDEEKASAITQIVKDKLGASPVNITELERVYVITWVSGNTTGKSILFGNELLQFRSK